MNVKDKLLEISSLLDELDDFEDEIPVIQQQYDYKLSDLYHNLENMTLDSKKCYRFCKELKSILLERREWKNNLAVFRKYNSQKLKLCNGKDNRKILISSICKEDNEIRNSKYKNRFYSDEDLKEKIG